MSLKQKNKFRPYLHYAPNENWMNDPNGLIYFKEEYHLFYQYNPNDSKWGPMHWGHAVSKDLIDWEELPIALYPDKNGTIFSGSAVIDWNNTTGFFPEEPGMVAIFTHHLENQANNPPKQSQSLAYSYDNGRTWIKYQNNPVLEHNSKVDFRDPKVFWHHASNKWVMVLATGQTVSVYSSNNLKDWSFESEFGEHVGSHDGVWECPDLFELQIDNSQESKWVLIVSIGDDPSLDKGSRTQYFIGTFDGSEFKAEHDEIKWLDYGKDNYAGVSFSDVPDRRIYLGWMSNWRYANSVPTVGWRSQMTLPRTLTLSRSGGRLQLLQRPVDEVENYFSKKIEINDELVKDKMEINIEEPRLEMVFNINNISSKEYALTLHHSDEQQTTIKINTKLNQLLLDRKHSGKVNFSDNFSLDQTLMLQDTEFINLRIIMDSASVEVFVNEGVYALTSLIYPDKVCKKISISSKDGDIQLTNSYVSAPSQYNSLS